MNEIFLFWKVILEREIPPPSKIYFLLEEVVLSHFFYLELHFIFFLFLLI